jgi:putative tryptophan/tyrosine transport system substrate-binding protein
MTRREFITFIGGTVAAWPFLTQGQSEPIRRVGVLVAGDKDDTEMKARLAEFAKALQELGWIDGRNIRVDYRWAGGDAERLRRHAAELAALRPDVILAGGTSTVGPLQQETHTVPIVFAGVVDPVGAGFVDNLARPRGNTTGFTQFEYGMSGKWLQLLKEIAPEVTRAGVLRDAATAVATSELAAIQAVAPSLGVEVSPLGTNEIENGIDAFARASGGGLIVTTGATPIRNRQLIITLAARYRLPAVYPYRFFAADGGLMSYGPDRIESFRSAASYVDRILKGEKPADLPVQVPTRYELVINLKTAKALGLSVPPALQARADEMIE